MRKLLKYLLNDFYCNEQTSFPSDVFLCGYHTQFCYTITHKALDRLLLKNIRQKSLCKGLCTAVSRAVQTCTVLRAVSWRKQGRKRNTKGWMTNGLLKKLYHARQEDIWNLVLMHGQSTVMHGQSALNLLIISSKQIFSHLALPLSQ